MKKTRETGVLMPIFSLPGNYGVGTLGKGAYAFVDFLAASNVDIWQMLPLNVTSYGDSPYQSPSSTGLNYYFIDLDILIEKKLLQKEECDKVDFGNDERRVSYCCLFNNRIKLLKVAFSRFNRKDKDFNKFVKEGKYSDFSFFMTMKELHNYRSWYEWDEKVYTSELEKRIAEKNEDTYLFYQWTQFEFLNQYRLLKAYANKKGIRIMGDMPLYLARDSVEAYKYPEMFCFDEKHNPTVVAGCPPDYFNADGQLWGNPIYNWDYMKSTGYFWWQERVNNNLQIFDILRIDHFRGIAGYYTIPFGSVNARCGEWRKGPAMDLFEGKKNLPIIAEDLGFIDEPVRKLLKESGYPGMKILEFAFDGSPDNEHKPFNTMYNFVTYTGTHDNETLLGYVENLSSDSLSIFKKDVEKQCQLMTVDYCDRTNKDLVKTVISLCLASPAKLAILPMADVLLLDNVARLNLPAILRQENWTYRYKFDDFSKKAVGFLKGMIEKYR